MNATYSKRHEEDNSILITPLPWFNDFHTKVSNGWYIVSTGFTAPGRGLHKYLQAEKLSRVLILMH